MPASRSLIALLVGTVVFFALWMVALKPSSSNNSGNTSQHGLGAFQADINKAHHAVTASNANDAASGNENASSSSSTAAHTATKSSTSAGSSKAKAHSASTAKATAHSPSKPKAKTTAKAKATPKRAAAIPAHMSLADEMSAVRTAVTHHRVLALLFYNPAAPDDQALKQELAAVPGHRGQVVKLAIPINNAASFTDVTQEVPVNLSPTLVLISRAGDANEDVGYTAPFVIDQQVTDALAAAS